MQLSSTQKQALENGEPVPVMIDQRECVVVRKDAFDLMQKEHELNHQEPRALLARSYPDSDWSAPEMDVYDDYDANRK